MSLNIHFLATRDVVVLKSGKIEKQITNYDGAWQTPTSVSRDIVASKDPIQSYKDWVRSIGSDDVFPVYQETDFFHEREPIGVEIINTAEEHIKEFEEWLAEMSQGCWNVEVEMW